MYCPKCGSSVAWDDVKCAACGTGVRETSEELKATPRTPFVLEEAAAWRQPLPESPAPRRKNGWILGFTLASLAVLVVGIFATAFFWNKDYSGDGESASSSQASLVRVNAQAPKMPEQETQFVAAVQQAKKAFNEAPDQRAQIETQSSRRSNICWVIQNLTVTNWVGTVTRLSSNIDGDRVLEVTTSDGIQLSTASHTPAGTTDPTSITSASTVFTQLQQVKQGDPIVFSGNFFPSHLDCVQEQSLSLKASITRPDFTFRFSSVNQPASAPATAVAAVAPPKPAPAAQPTVPTVAQAIATPPAPKPTLAAVSKPTPPPAAPKQAIAVASKPNIAPAPPKQTLVAVTKPTPALKQNAAPAAPKETVASNDHPEAGVMDSLTVKENGIFHLFTATGWAAADNTQKPEAVFLTVDGKKVCDATLGDPRHDGQSAAMGWHCGFALRADNAGSRHKLDAWATVRAGSRVVQRRLGDSQVFQDE